MLETALHSRHVELGGRMVDFAGWHMPVQYSSIVDEHNAVRNRAGIFDIAHMGRLIFTGPQTCDLLDRLLTNDVTKLQEGQIRYALICREDGGILDDVLVYRFADYYMLVVNASNREKIVAWIDQHKDGYDCHVSDATRDRFMLALQGPKAVEILNPLCTGDVSTMKYYTGAEMTISFIPGIVSRTGYTGEDGFEVIVPTEQAVTLWGKLTEAGEPHGLLPAGLGCRDTLRLEAAMPLYGHEMDETVDPYTAGLNFAVKLEAGDFIGKEALIAKKADDSLPKRVGMVLDGKRIAREGAELYAGDERIGEVTSGTFSPTLEQSIAMGYVPNSHAEIGTAIEVDIRGKRVKAKVTALPFYKRG